MAQTVIYRGIWQQVLKKEQVCNPLLAHSYFCNRVPEMTTFSPQKYSKTQNTVFYQTGLAIVLNCEFMCLHQQIDLRKIFSILICGLKSAHK